MSNETSWLTKPKAKTVRLSTTGLSMLGLLGVAIAAPGCGEDNPLCCSEDDFQVGGTIELEGTSGVALQAVADFAGIAAASVDDLTIACRGIAEGLDATADDRAAAEAIVDKRARMEAYCNLAVDQIGVFTAQASITVNIEPAECSVNVSAKADCQARCSVDGECDIQATPPTCEGGSLEVACSGSCTAEAGATLNCTGSCTGGCTGSCTSTGGVMCQGRCDGECEAGAIQTDGTCTGMCMGTCEATAPGVMCDGTCSGSCDAACEATANASVTCDGQCDAEFEPLRCEGGMLTGGCEVEASCDANCDASLEAKAECSPPRISIDVTGDADIGGKLKAVLEANLGLVAALEGRLEGMGEIAGTFVGSINADLLVDIKAACIPVVIAAAGEAGSDVTASLSASVNVIGAVGG